jgi:tetratricopeptide (TPR) repeat protein
MVEKVNLRSRTKGKDIHVRLGSRNWPTCKPMYRPFFIAFGSIAWSLMLATLKAGPADDLIAKGDACALKFEANEALKFYLTAEKLEPANEHLFARISREYRHEMSDAMQAEQKLNLGSTAVEYAKRAVSLAPNDPEAQLAVAISYGKLELLQGNREKFEASRIIKNAADKVIEVDPSSDLAWHILGRWHMALADVNAFERALAAMAYGKLPESTYEEAALCFEKAIAINPNRLMHYIELGRVYAHMGRTDDARSFIKKGLAMQETEKDDPETKREGQELLAKLR